MARPLSEQSDVGEVFGRPRSPASIDCPQRRQSDEQSGPALHWPSLIQPIGLDENILGDVFGFMHGAEDAGGNSQDASAMLHRRFGPNLVLRRLARETSHRGRVCSVSVE